MTKQSTKTPARRTKPTPAPRRAAPAIPPAVALRQFVVRCTFVGEIKKKRVDGSFRFLLEAANADAVRPKLGAAVRRLRRAGELPARCDVYVEFVLQLEGLRQGVVADFERWEHDPRRFQSGCVTFSETCTVHECGNAEPAFRFGAAPKAPASEGSPAAQLAEPTAASRQ